MTDDGMRVVLVFFQEFFGAGESNLVDVFVDFFGGHTDTLVADGERFSFFIDADADTQVFCIGIALSAGHDGFQFLAGIHSVRYYFAQENFLIAVQEFFDNGEDIIRSNPDFS